MASTPWNPNSGELLDRRYKLIEPIGEGAMGVIYRADHVRLKRPVAVKLLHPRVAQQPGYRARFEREVATAASINHPNIVQCHDSGETDAGALYLVMELLEGRTLKQAIAAEGRMSLARATSLALQLMDGMSAAHKAGLVHRDLKPDNIFLVPDRRGGETVKILDFGIAKAIEGDAVRDLTATGVILGTPAYLPPESQIEPVSYAGDRYAIGVIMLELMLGRRVFGGNEGPSATILLQVVTTSIEVPERLAETVYGQLIMQAVAKDPDDRAATTDAMLHALSSAPEADFTLTTDEIPPFPSSGNGALLLNLTQSGRGMLRELPGPLIYYPVAQFDPDAPTQLLPQNQPGPDTTVDPDLREATRRSANAHPAPPIAPPTPEIVEVADGAAAGPPKKAQVDRTAIEPTVATLTPARLLTILGGLLLLIAVAVVVVTSLTADEKGAEDESVDGKVTESQDENKDERESEKQQESVAKAKANPRAKGKGKAKAKGSDAKDAKKEEVLELWDEDEVDERAAPPVIDDGYVPTGSSPSDIRLPGSK